MRRFAAALLVAALLPAGLVAQDSPEERVRRILTETPLIDGHNDLPWAIRGYDDAPGSVVGYDISRRAPDDGQTDLERLEEGMVGAQFWSIYVSCGSRDEGAAKTQLEEIDIAKRLYRTYPGHLGEALTASEVEEVFAGGRIASLMGMEGGHVIENSLGALRGFYEAGARYLTLTHGCNTDWADSATDDPEHGGLTAFGEEVVREMNRMGMLVDLSHVSAATMHDALDVAEAPVIFSHSSARGVTDHARNVPDDVLRRLPDNGGVVMVTFVAPYISDAVRTYEGPEEDEPRATIADVADHIEHVRDVAGIDHVGIGSDFDGTSSLPVRLEDVGDFPNLFLELVERGWTDEELAKLAGENVLRVMREAEATARRLQRQRPASTATIEDLDGRPEASR